MDKRRCESCSSELTRRRYDNGQLENLNNFEKRRFCHKPECRDYANRNKIRPSKGFIEPPRPDDEVHIDRFLAMKQFNPATPRIPP